MEKREELLKRIDTLAIAICTLMQEEAKDEFFEFQEGREQSGAGYKKKYSAGRTYYKGSRKGQVRDVFEIDGKGFNDLWEALTPFAMKSVNSFYYSRKIFSEDVQDALFDIKYQTLYVLRFHGPNPSGSSFSQFFPLICKNILSTISRRMYGVKDKEIEKAVGDDLILTGKGNKLIWDEEKYCWIKKGAVSYKTKVNFKTVSLHNDVMVEEDEKGGYVIDYVKSTGNELENMEFQACIPDDLKGIVNSVVNGYSLKEASEAADIEVKNMKKLLKSFAADFYNARV
jgi:hypothetical protein